jgi:hypothetical protein
MKQGYQWISNKWDGGQEGKKIENKKKAKRGKRRKKRRKIVKKNEM